jgi:hypothetical protein
MPRTARAAKSNQLIRLGGFHGVLGLRHGLFQGGGDLPADGLPLVGRHEITSCSY